MALWQYSFHALPRCSILEKYGCIKKSITDKDFNDTIWFNNWNHNIFLNSITYLKKNTHWDSEVLFFGDYEGDSIEISYDKNIIDSIFMRIDLRIEYVAMTRRMIETVSESCLVIITTNFNVIEPKLETIMPLIESSGLLEV